MRYYQYIRRYGGFVVIVVSVVYLAVSLYLEQKG